MSFLECMLTSENTSAKAILFRTVLRLLLVVHKLLCYVSIGLSSDIPFFPKPGSGEVPECCRWSSVHQAGEFQPSVRDAEQCQGLTKGVGKQSSCWSFVSNRGQPRHSRTNSLFVVFAGTNTARFLLLTQVILHRQVERIMCCLKT